MHGIRTNYITLKKLVFPLFIYYYYYYYYYCYCYHFFANSICNNNN